MSEMLSLLYGFFGYNQILVSHTDQLKTTFKTKWGTFTYSEMPFRLINVGITFQKEMDTTFCTLINKVVVIYLDDIIVYSNNRRNHIAHLKKIFEHCREYGISLNSKDSIFLVTKGKHLGFIVSKEGIIIDPEKT